MGWGSEEILSTQSFDTRAECDAVAAVLKVEMDKDGWYRCKPYTFDGEAKE